MIIRCIYSVLTPPAVYVARHGYETIQSGNQISPVQFAASGVRVAKKHVFPLVITCSAFKSACLMKNQKADRPGASGWQP